ncbi:MAG: nicotinamide riboside transporter PnuC [Actinomycetes bacterium]
MNVLASPFTVWGYEMTYLELVAVITSAIGVWLGTTGKKITWPWWALSSALYGWLFWDYELYASAALQLVFIAAAVWGWFGWGPQGAQPRVASNRNRIIVAILGLVCTAVLAPWLASIGAAAMWPDSFGLIFSVVAQVIMVREYRENWIVWFVVDAVYTIEYVWVGLYITALLYGVFTAIAVRGWIHWKQSV